jgi:hypothetical protein
MRRALLALALVACVRRNDTPRPPVAPFDELPPPNPVVEATDEDARACARLAALGCPEAPHCLGVMSVARTDHIIVPSACLAAAVDVAAVRRCGDTGTLTFACVR